MVFNATFNNISVNIGQLYWWRKLDLSQVTNKTLSHNVSSTPRHEQGLNSQL